MVNSLIVGCITASMARAYELAAGASPSVAVIANPKRRPGAATQLASLVRSHDWVGLFIGDEEDASVVDEALATLPRHSPTTCLLFAAGRQLPTSSALSLARRASIVQLDKDQLFELSGVTRNVVAAMYALREAGVGKLVVTSADGVHAAVDGNWYCRPSLRVADPRIFTGHEEVFAGTMLAGLAHKKSWEATLRSAIAAAAMHIGGHERQGGWQELRQFELATPKNPYGNLVSRQPLPKAKKQLPAKAGAVAMGRLAFRFLLSLVG